MEGYEETLEINQQTHTGFLRCTEILLDLIKGVFKDKLNIDNEKPIFGRLPQMRMEYTVKYRLLPLRVPLGFALGISLRPNAVFDHTSLSWYNKSWKTLVKKITVRTKSHIHTVYFFFYIVKHPLAKPDGLLNSIQLCPCKYMQRTICYLLWNTN